MRVVCFLSDVVTKKNYTQNPPFHMTYSNVIVADNKGLNMFLVLIKLRFFKFSPYIILIVLLVHTKKFLHSILVPAQFIYV